MRKKLHEQLPIAPAPIRHERAREYQEVSAVLDRMPALLDLVDADIRQGRSADTGRPGLSAEQVQRALVVKHAERISYDRLAFQLADSATLRWFVRLDLAAEPPAAETWQQNIKRVSAATVDAHNRALLLLAKDDGVEDGRVIRGDCTVVPTDIHHPTDSSLIWDGVRVLTRLLKRAEGEGVELIFSDHTLRARRRNLAIGNAKSEAKRRPLYADLLKVGRKVLGYARRAVEPIKAWSPPDGDVMARVRVLATAEQLEHYIPLIDKVLAQADRRVIRGEQVPVQDKLFSLFEPHTDLILKGGREAEFGHKVYLAGGRSGLITDVVDLDGNPADTTLVEDWLVRHVDLYGGPPTRTAFDGGFASRPNLDHLKDNGVGDAVFHKKRGLPISDMARSTWIYKTTRRYRAGIESAISYLKRCFGWDRCILSGRASFGAYVRSAVLTCNLFVYARHLIPDG